MAIHITCLSILEKFEIESGISIFVFFGGGGTPCIMRVSTIHTTFFTRIPE